MDGSATGVVDLPRLAGRVQTICWVAVALQLAALALHGGTPSVATLAPPLSYGAAAVACRFAIGAGRVQLATAILVTTAWATVNLEAFFGGGVRSIDFTLNAVVVLGAAVFVGLRTGIATAAAAALAGAFMAWAEMTGLLPAAPPAPMWAVLLVHGANLSLVAVFVAMARQDVTSALEQASRELEERRQTEAALLEQESRLQAVNEERAKAEAQLRQSQKMEALGQLAGGVAHDFNNLLTLIHGHLAILQAGAGPLATQDSLGTIEAAVNRAAALTRQLLAFSRRQVLNVRPVDLNDVVTRLVRLISRLLGETIQVDLRPGTALPAVLADAGLLDQVLMNLCVNARDAMPGGGSLTIATSYLSVGEQEATRHPDARPGNFLCLSVNDTGCGMSAETMAQIFQPFYTTKESGKGTGLGLATVYGIVRQHRGWVEVKSEEGWGTEFRVYLPASEAQPAWEGSSQPPVVSPGRERLLLVEDDSEVRELLAWQLRDAGYTVEEAASGQAALAWWRERTGPVDLVVTDMVMPDGLSGRELVAHLRAECSDQRVLFMSGYSMDLAQDGIASDTRTRFIQKPFTAADLSAAVREVLAG